MKKIILLILTMILLTGCGVYNLGNFVTPDNTGFIDCIKKLDTPKKIAKYMADNFTVKLNYYYTPDPYKLWLEKEGDCNDLATFGMYAAAYHGYNCFRVDIWYNNSGHSIAVYDEGLLSFTDYGNYFSGFECINDIVEEYYMGSNYKNYKVYDYNNILIK